MITSLFLNKKMAPRRGLEPPTYRLTAECSTIELSRNVITFIIITDFLDYATLFYLNFLYSKLNSIYLIYKINS